MWALGRLSLTMAMTVNVPEDPGSLAAEASRRRLSVDELSAQLLAAGSTEDPLDAFIGSGRSGHGDQHCLKRRIFHLPSGR
jgi:hypothetical protein